MPASSAARRASGEARRRWPSPASASAAGADGSGRGGGAAIAVGAALGFADIAGCTCKSPADPSVTTAAGAIDLFGVSFFSAAFGFIAIGLGGSGVAAASGPGSSLAAPGGGFVLALESLVAGGLIGGITVAGVGLSPSLSLI